MSLDISADLITGTVGKVVDALTSYFPSEEDKTKLKLAVLQADQAGELDQVKTDLSVIISDSQSTDKWTSRARPSFLYVIYALILWSIPFSIIYAVSPAIGNSVVAGFGFWLKAIPDQMWQLFGVGYLGYAGSRTWDKHQETKAKIAAITSGSN